MSEFAIPKGVRGLCFYASGLVQAGCPYLAVRSEGQVWRAVARR